MQIDTSTVIQMIGYLGAILMFSTFYMKRMIPLRAVGIASNATFIIFSSISHVWPLLALHTALLPLNTIRLIQMIKLVNKVKEASAGNFSMDFLVPFMTKEDFKTGDTVFRKGAAADKIYYLQKGRAVLSELSVTLKEGDLIGEIGVFSNQKQRTASLVCEADTRFLTIPDKQILQLYYQNPKFGMHLVQMIIHRLLRNHDIEMLRQDEEKQKLEETRLRHEEQRLKHEDERLKLEEERLMLEEERLMLKKERLKLADNQFNEERRMG